MFGFSGSRSLRVMTITAALSLTLALGGCSWCKKKAPVNVAHDSVPTLDGNGAAGGNGSSLDPNFERNSLGTPVEFDSAAGIQDVHFDYDRAEVRRDQTAILDRNIAYFKAHPEVKIMIEGHTDERGTVEYNLTLGERRAASVKDYLVSNGIGVERLATTSKGKENPIDPGHGESAWSRNRRGHFMKMQ